jgi:4-amino-4-deoxy-L-arabinose transferase-like glycosyltransferase
LALVAIFTACVFRAVTQPITTDEAHVYLNYLHGQDFELIFTRKYDSSNHVLQTILSYGAVKLLGSREIVLRSPSLAAAALYFIAMWRFAFFSFRRSWLAALAVALAVMNPLLLDHFSLARGYGLALALFAWSLYFSLRYLHDRNERALTLAGLFLGLSVAANLTFAIPGAGLSFALLASLPNCLRQRALVLRYAVSVLFPAGLLIVPLSSANRTDFYFGSGTYAESIVKLSSVSLVYSGQAPLFPDLTDA